MHRKSRFLGMSPMNDGSYSVLIPDDLVPSKPGKRRKTADAHVAKVLVGAIAAVAVSAAQAQDQTPEPAAKSTQSAPAPKPAAAAESAQIEEIIVTGTSIKREDDEALPVTVVTQEEMDLRDAGAPVDLLTALPAVANVPINESTQGGAGARGDVAAVSLRGLGSGSTLLLLNGRRMATHGISQNEGGVPTLSVNANTFPSRGLSRIDVLRDGASSIYGSDAVAGVINFIVDNAFVGNELSLEAGFNEIASGDNRRLTFTHGDFYLDGKLHWTSTVDYYDRDATMSSDIMGDSDKTSKAPDGFNALTGRFFDRSSSSAYPSFRVDGSSTTQYLVPTATGAAFSNSVPARDGEFASDYYYDMNVGYSLPETTRLNLFNQFDYQVNDALTVFGEMMLYRAESRMVRAPVAYTASSNRDIVLGIDNPWNPYGSRFYAEDGSANTDGTQRLTGTPQETTIVAYRFVDNGNETVDVDTNAYRFVLGGRGDFGNSWNWEAAGMYSRSGTKDVSLNAVRESAVLATIDAGDYNPWGYDFAVVDGAVVPTTPYTNSQASIDTFSQHFIQTGRDILYSVDARVTGELFDLWAGPVQVAAGAEHRWDNYSLTRPQYHGLNYEGNDLGLDPTDNDFMQASAVGNIIGDRTVAAGFVETVIPLVAEYNEIPGIRSLSIGASMRYERYSDFGSTANPKFTLDFRPIDEVMVRASYNEGFRAPSLASIYYPSRSTVAQYSDPYRQNVTGLPEDGQYGRYQTTTGNSNLKPETSRGMTLGTVVDVPWIDGLSFSIDYFRIEQDNLIAAPNANQLRDDDAARLRAATQAALASGVAYDDIDLGSGTDNYEGNPYVVREAVTDADRQYFADYNADKPQSEWVAPVGLLVDTLVPFDNLDTSEIAGYDFNITYRMPGFSWGNLNLSTDWSYLDKYERLGGASGVSSTQLGIDGKPRVRGSASAVWSYDLWSAGLSAYYIGDYADTGASITDAVYQELGRPDYVKTVDGVHYWKVDDTVTFNAFLSKSFISDSKLLDGTTIRLGVKNLTDEKPPLTSDTGGYDASVYNSIAVGRVWTLRLNKTF
jgi:iron complex outermembrane receptor protein